MAKRTIVTPDAPTDIPGVSTVLTLRQEMKSEARVRADEVLGKTNNSLRASEAVAAKKTKKSAAMDGIATHNQVRAIIKSAVGKAAAKQHNSLRVTESVLRKAINRVAASDRIRQELLSVIATKASQLAAKFNGDLRTVQALLSSDIKRRIAIANIALKQEMFKALSDDLTMVSSKASTELRIAELLLKKQIGEVTVTQTSVAGPTVVASIVPLTNHIESVKITTIARRTDGLEIAHYEFTATLQAEHGAGILTFVGAPADGQFVNVNGRPYTYRDVLAAADDIQRAAGDASTSLNNLIAGIMDSGTPGTEYAVGTTRNADINARRSTGTTMDGVARLGGTAGNGITTTTDVGGASWGGATLSGGTDLTEHATSKSVIHETAGIAVAWDANVAVNGAAYEVSGTAEAAKDVDWTTIVTRGESRLQ